MARYARVSSAPPAETPTRASQLAAVRERVATAGLTVSAARPWLDDGERGATVVRPALERRRDVVAAGRVDRRDGPSPDRLARQEASHVRWVAEFRRAGVEVMCRNRALGQSPEDDLRRQGHGLMAASERAKSLDRPRRGQRHAARVGTVHVRSGAPDGDRDGTKDEGGGQAREESMPDAARVVRPVVAWVGRDRRTRGAVCRRLPPAGEVTRTGKTGWDRRGVWGILTHPADHGAAALGQTRRAMSTSAVPPEDWSTIPVPARVESEGCAAVQEPWREHQRHARPARRGARSLRQGVLPCQPGGEAF